MLCLSLLFYRGILVQEKGGLGRRVQMSFSAPAFGVYWWKTERQSFCVSVPQAEGSEGVGKHWVCA